MLRSFPAILPRTGFLPSPAPAIRDLVRRMRWTWHDQDPKRGDKARKKARRTQIAVWIALIVITGCGSFLAVTQLGFLTQAERWVSDMRVAMMLAPEKEQHPDIVIAELNEETLEAFPYRSPVDRGFLANLVRQLDEKGARLIWLDVLPDAPTEPEKDLELYNAIRQTKAKMVVSYLDGPPFVTERQKAYLDEMVPPEARGIATLDVTPQDNTVRRIHPGHVTVDGEWMDSAPRLIAKFVGREPSDKPVEISWRGVPERPKGAPPFRTYPSHAVPVLPDEWFKDKIVLVGANLSLTDRHRTPFASITLGQDANEGSLPGIVIQAHALGHLLDGRISPVPPTWVMVIIALAAAAAGVGLGLLPIPAWARVVGGGGGVVLLWVGGFWFFSVSNILLPLVMPTLALSLATWVTDFISGREARRQKDFIQGAFSRYVSPKVVSELVADPTKLSIEGERRILSLMFTDIAGFTGLSEVVGSRKLSEILNAYLNEACKIIQKYDGTVDKFIGDAIFAIFNAPIEQPDHAERIIKCAIELDRFAEDFRAKQIADGIEMGVTRIGIHTGEAVVGNFGAESKMEYTALGDTVNTASRLEGINKYFGTRILVSDTTRSLLPKEMPFRPIAVVKPKGRAASLPIWQPLTIEEANDEWIYHWRLAYAAMEAGDEKALALLEQLNAERPDDVTCELHLERWREGARDVEIVMESK